MQFTTDSGANVVVAVDDDEPGVRLAARRDGSLVRAGQTFDDALEGIHTAAESALRIFRDGRLKPDTVEIEFGVRLTAEAGAVIAKSTLEGHLVVKLSWRPGTTGSTGEPDPPESDDSDDPDR